MSDHFLFNLPVVPQINKENNEFNKNKSIEHRLDMLEAQVRTSEKGNKIVSEELQKLQFDYLETVIRVEKNFRKNDDEMTQINRKFQNIKLDMERISNLIENLSKTKSFFDKTLTITDIVPHVNIKDMNFDKKIDNLSYQIDLMSKDMLQFRDMCNDLHNEIIGASTKIDTFDDRYRTALKNFSPGKDLSHELPSYNLIQSKIEDHDRKIVHFSHTMNKLESLSHEITVVNGLVVQEKSDRLEMKDSIYKKLNQYEKLCNSGTHLRPVGPEKSKLFETEIRLELERIEFQQSAIIESISKKVDMKISELNLEQKYKEFDMNMSKKLNLKSQREHESNITYDHRFKGISEEIRKECFRCNQLTRDIAATQFMKIKEIEGRLYDIGKYNESSYNEVRKKISEINTSRLLNQQNFKDHLDILGKKIVVFNDFLNEKIRSESNHLMMTSEKIEKTLTRTVDTELSKFGIQLTNIMTCLNVTASNILTMHKDHTTTLLELLEQLKFNFNLELEPVERSEDDFKNESEDLLHNQDELQAEITKTKTNHSVMIDTVMASIKDCGDQSLKMV